MRSRWGALLILAAFGCAASPAGDDASASAVRCPGSGRLCPTLAGAVVTCEGESCVARRASDGATLADCVGRGVYDVDLRTDARNCGACGHWCATGACVEGTCERASTGLCGYGSFNCDGVCVAGLTDPSNCGRCGASCGPSEACFSGQCFACPHGGVRCGETCADLANDPSNCGACGVACGDGDECVEGRCGAPLAKLRSPISTMYVNTSRPWLFWTLPTGATGARVEICTWPECARVEHRWEVDGERLRVPTPLPDGPHFWRVFARRDGGFDTVAARPWEFVVRTGASFGEQQGSRAMLDVNGDGLEERYSRRPASTTDPTVGSAIVITYGGDVRPPTELPFEGSITAAGDLNGDGYGDLVAIRSITVIELGGRSSPGFTLSIHFGGIAGVVTTPETGLSFYPISDDRNPYRQAIAMPAGTRGSGFGDLRVEYTRETPTTTNFTRLIRGARHLGDAQTRSARDRQGYSGGLPVSLLADFDADGRSDEVLAWSDNFPPGPRLMTTVLMGSGAVLGIGTCGSVYPLWTTLNPVWLVGDFDDDGYDDLSASIIDGYGRPTTTELYRGGPWGLDEDHCTLSPPR